MDGDPPRMMQASIAHHVDVMRSHSVNVCIATPFGP
jgi:hypothetical protein